MKKALLMSAAAILALSGGLAMAQDCDSTKLEATPTSRFKDNGDGTVTDAKTKLTWRRCVGGMSWNGSTCEGQSSTYTYSTVEIAIDEMNEKKDSGHSNWRLPTREELATIVETRCYKPAVNLTVFPFTPESGYWTSTESPGSNPRAWIIHFLNGGEYVANKTQHWRLRPVEGK